MNSAPALERNRQKNKRHIFAPTAGVRCSISPKLCIVIEDVVPVLKDHHFSLQRIVFTTAVKVDFCGQWVKNLVYVFCFFCRSLSLLKNSFLALVYSQISTDLDKILHTPIVVWNTLLGRLRPGSTRGRLQAKPEWLFFSVILVTHPKSYRRRITANRHKGGVDGCYREKFRNFVVWAEPDPKNSIFCWFLGYPSTNLCTAYRKQFYPKSVVPMESRDSEGVPFASLESLVTRHLADIGPWRVPKSGQVTSQKLKSCKEKFNDSKMLFFSIYDEK